MPAEDWPLPPPKVQRALSSEDIDGWRKGTICIDTLCAFARARVQRREMGQGNRPQHYTEQARCTHCGLIGLWFAGAVLGCPWCSNRAANKPIPRPGLVHCGACIHFERVSEPLEHPHLGHCTRGEPEPIAGL